MPIGGGSASARALRQPVCQREPTDLSTRAAGGAKLRILMASGLWSPAYGLRHLCLAWLWPLAFFDDLIYDHRVDKSLTVTTRLTPPELTTRPTGGDPAAQRQLCAGDAVEPGLSIAAASETAASDPNVDPNARSEEHTSELQSL